MNYIQLNKRLQDEIGRYEISYDELYGGLYNVRIIVKGFKFYSAIVNFLLDDFMEVRRHYDAEEKRYYIFTRVDKRLIWARK